MDRKDWVIEQEKRKILQEEMVTEMKKNKFINEIKKEFNYENLNQDFDVDIFGINFKFKVNE